jgi:hypothetical protein
MSLLFQLLRRELSFVAFYNLCELGDFPILSNSITLNDLGAVVVVYPEPTKILSSRRPLPVWITERFKEDWLGLLFLEAIALGYFRL